MLRSGKIQRWNFFLSVAAAAANRKKVFFLSVQGVASIRRIHLHIEITINWTEIVYDLSSSYVFDLDGTGNFPWPFVACKIQMSLYGAETANEDDNTTKQKIVKSQTVQVNSMPL